MIVNEQELKSFAIKMAKEIDFPQIIGLYGDLGTGKSTFARSFIRTLMSDETLDVPSPTFNIVHTYSFKNKHIWHCDLYRLKCIEETDTLNLQEAFNSSCCCLIEWPQIIEGILPPKHIKIKFSHHNEHARRVEIF